ncbi:hypothetical protein OG746_05650 [Streptomyces sp. NBC_01016]|uniref:hypothetical protein n=1 Tax=Streptomyces sp. NBC_01016 TaxID=2903720 RepID=UPI002250286D|nr:hypothetical protein [Streptomyces sp. NBC_01016]MCX4828218.1 hypothetical protein [Streptomyces sp. NBC_01016]
MTSLAYGRGTGRLLGALIPDWLEMPLLIVFLVAIAVGWVGIIRALSKVRRARGVGWVEMVRTLVEMSRSRRWR